MDTIAIQDALEAAVVALPALTTVWEDDPDPPATQGVDYQEVFLRWADPVNEENTGSFRQGGFMQISLRYRQDQNPLLIKQRAELIRSTFPRGRAISGAGVVVNIERTPSIEVMPIDDGRRVRIIRVPFYANGLT